MDRSGEIIDEDLAENLNEDHETSRTRKTNATPFRPESSLSTSTKKNKSNFSPTTLIIIAAAVMIVLACIVGLITNGTTSSSKPHASGKHQKSCPQFMTLSKEFPQQNERLFRSLRSSIESFYEGHTSVFSLFSTDEKILKNLMFRIVNSTKECLEIEKSQDPISLDENDISKRKISDYRNELKQRSIMIVNNINNAPVNEVQVLHSVCDTENPLVKPSIIFITIKVPSAPANGIKHIDFIFNFLESQWSSLKENIRTPLITRILDQTFFVKPE